MPKLWNDTVAAHQHAVRATVLDVTARLVAEHGPTAVTMTQIAGAAGIGRATLYKYFPDVGAILNAWHERRITDHIEQLKAIVSGPGDIGQRLEQALSTYARIGFDHHGGELSALLHRGSHATQARHQLHDMVRRLLDDGVTAGIVRADIATTELTEYCLAALSAAQSSRSEAATRRLVVLVLDGLRPPT
ncbi:TetR/AcrR family transcriptional regulator [Nocardia sp. NPDC057353]|uniref:TetR/AcrR family transcriptional regulator n=1 Tax=Nocardia sp. NPDC057353 TaxID=3346104 RepID=UPI0036433775